MRESLAAMKAALRVLTAINEKRQPSDDDVKDLESYAGAHPHKTGLDELACDVIQRALHRRAERRRAAGG